MFLMCNCKEHLGLLSPTRYGDWIDLIIGNWDFSLSPLDQCFKLRPGWYRIKVIAISWLFSGLYEILEVGSGQVCI